MGIQVAAREERRNLLLAGLPPFSRFAAVHRYNGSWRRIELRHLVVEIEGQSLAPDAEDQPLMSLGNRLGLRRAGGGKGTTLLSLVMLGLYLLVSEDRV